MNKQTTLDRNVVITFNDKLNNDFIELSRLIRSRVDSKINLNLFDEIPHLTLYQSSFPEENIEQIVQNLSEIAYSTKPFILQLNSKSNHSSGTIFIDAKRSKKLFDLHEKIMTSLNPLRDGFYNPGSFNLPGITDEEKENIINFGMFRVKKDYLPHVSVARVYNPEKDGLVALSLIPKKIDYQTMVEHISFVETGHDGTCKKILKVFKLSNKN